MSELAASLPAGISRLRDLVELGKPRLSVLVIFTTAIGVWMSGAAMGPLRTLWFLLATSCLVAAANTLNCWIEREIDALMQRTCRRPLPAGRMEPPVALAFGLVLGGLSLASIFWLTNTLTLALGTTALLSYALVYTPLKRVTPWAVVVGAVPGAIPPLMGWTAATGELAGPGWFLFGILFLWQLPHFTAISLYLKEDFRRGGIRVLPLCFGNVVARRLLFLFTVALVLWSLGGQPLGLAGTAYTITSLILGLGFLAVAGSGLRSAVGSTWARQLFAYTLVYLPVLVAVLVLD